MAHAATWPLAEVVGLKAETFYAVEYAFRSGPYPYCLSFERPIIIWAFSGPILYGRLFFLGLKARNDEHHMLSISGPNRNAQGPNSCQSTNKFSQVA
jgi:hypothetical protein